MIDFTHSHRKRKLNRKQTWQRKSSIDLYQAKHFGKQTDAIYFFFGLDNASDLFI